MNSTGNTFNIELLQDLLNETFLGKCGKHGGYNHMNTVAFHCFDCKLCMCLYCVDEDSTDHRSHNHIQIHPHNYQSSVSTTDIRRLNLIDCSDIKHYKHISLELVLLHPKQASSRSVKYATKCENCHALLRGNNTHYCSLACKISKMYDSSSETKAGSDQNQSINLTEENVDQTIVPGEGEMLQELLKETLVVECKTHEKIYYFRNKAVVDFYCFDCKLYLCPYCLVSDSTHRSHKYIQLTTHLSGCYVRATAVESLNLIDISNIQKFTFKEHEYLLLHARQEAPKFVKENHSRCKNCHVEIHSPKEYCSLACKASTIYKPETLPETRTELNPKQGVDLTEENVDSTISVPKRRKMSS